MNLEIDSRVELVLAAALATRSEVERLCAQARRDKCRSIVLPSGAIVAAQHFLGDEEIKISCRIGCARGSMDADAKRYETELAIDLGAHEIELVPSLAKIHDGDFKAVLREIRDIAEAADERLVKVAFEPASWTDETLRELVQVVLDSGAQYLCTSQKSPGGLEEVRELRELCGPGFGIVARVDRFAEAEAVLGAGANLAALAAG